MNPRKISLILFALCGFWGVRFFMTLIFNIVEITEPMVIFCASGVIWSYLLADGIQKYTLRQRVEAQKEGTKKES